MRSDSEKNYDTIFKKLKNFIELDTNVFVDKFHEMKYDADDCYKLNRKLETSDIPKTTIDPKKKKTNVPKLKTCSNI